MKAKDVPVALDDDGTEVRVVCGSYRGRRGPVHDIAAEPVYLDVSIPAGKFCNASHPLAVPTEPAGWADTTPPSQADNRTLVLFDRGDEIEVQAGDEGIRFLLVSGQPLKEPVAWYGPIVMNTQDELRHAFAQLDDGTFLRPDAPR